MTNPLVSVIVPNYNHARYLEQRLDTVFSQTYQNFEVIILDDKSTDNSLEIINRYKDNPHLSQIVVNEQNTGSPFKQWDKGINLAKGELIWIAESDDYNELTFLEELIIEWNKHNNVVAAFSNYVMFWGDKYLYSKERKARVYSGKDYIINRLIRYCDIRNASGVVFSKNAYLNISKDYTSYKSAGDLRFWSEILQYGKCVKINKNLTYFRQNITSVTGTNGSKGIISKEDKMVYDYVCRVYKLSNFQEKMVRLKKAVQYLNSPYDSENIRQEILDIWHIHRGQKVSLIFKFIFWLSGSLERHLGILI